jgi:fumarate reductase flavoprotein subunit
MTMQYSNCYVNELGSRFCDESGGGGLGTSQSGKLIESQGYVFSIADQSMIEKYEAGGCERHYSGFADACVGATLDLQSEIAQYASESFIYTADTIQALGEAIAANVEAFDVDRFVDEIEAYNRFAAAGTDEYYGKDAAYLWPIEDGPFYAFQICSGMLNTNGGIRINENAQVTDARGRVVNGLFAAGVCCSGFDGEVYGGGTCQTVGMWAGSKAARWTIENILGGSVASNWMGDVRSQDPNAAAGPSGPPPA